MFRLIIIICALSTTASAADTQIQSATPILMIFPRNKGDTLRQRIEPIYREAFKRIGKAVRFSGCVPYLCARYVLDGSADGEMGRVLGYGEKYPQLIRTDESILTINFDAFSINTNSKVNSWNDLTGKSFKIAYIQGIYLLDKNLHARIIPSNLVMVEHWRDGLQKLLTKNADIFICEEQTVLKELKGVYKAINDVGTVDTVALYPYFNKNNKSVSDQLSIKLKEMKADGTMARLISNN